jgi:FixJ family two-component response regulator
VKPDTKSNVSQPTVIACVEDDASVGEALEGLLFAFGFAPVIYTSAETFLNSAPLDRISCLIVDVELGGMSGIDLQQRLVEQGKRIPTIVITAFADERMRRRALDGGAVAFLQKPIGAAGLMAEISSAMRYGSGDEANV